jgi:hypothetical protein
MTTADELYELLPAFYRIRDAEQGGALRALVDVLAAEVEVLNDSLDQFYDDLFIETCAPWVTPYIGDLVGYRPLDGQPPGVASPRAEVANTIAYRRRKGTAAMLEQLGRDVTGWPAAVVEFFERLATSQYLNHMRPAAVATVNLRDRTALELRGGAFDRAARTAQVGRIEIGAGRYNIPNIGIFLWRTMAVPLRRSPLTPVDGDGRRFRVDPLGADTPLYGRPRTEDEVTHLAGPLDVPMPLTRRYLDAHLADYYGADQGLLIEVNGTVVSRADIRVCDLSDLGTGWAHEPKPGSGRVAIDPVLGRICFPETAGANPTATFHYGQSVPVGGGAYDRGAPATLNGPVVRIASGGDLTGQAASGGTVELTGSGRYAAPAAISTTTTAPVLLRAADQTRPHLAATGPIRLDAAPGGSVLLDGLLISGGPLVLPPAPDNELRTVHMRHCTLVPGRGRSATGEAVDPRAVSLLVLDPLARVVVERSVIGSVVAVEGATVTLVDTVLDAGSPTGIAYCGRAPGGDGSSAAEQEVGDGLTAGAGLALHGCTVVGRVHAVRLDIEDSIVLARLPDPAGGWTAPVRAQRRQVGCVRFSYLPAGSRTAVPYRCQPTGTGNHPRFVSLRYGDPGYAQLRPDTPDAIRRGAGDESEMGVTHHLYQPQREENLRRRLDEYLRFGLSAGLIFAS